VNGRADDYPAWNRRAVCQKCGALEGAPCVVLAHSHTSRGAPPGSQAAHPHKGRRIMDRQYGGIRLADWRARAKTTKRERRCLNRAPFHIGGVAVLCSRWNGHKDDHAAQGRTWPRYQRRQTA
jgi:hypothetical protein